jgi:hypothetical protein
MPQNNSSYQNFEGWKLVTTFSGAVLLHSVARLCSAKREDDRSIRSWKGFGRKGS